MEFEDHNPQSEDSKGDHVMQAQPLKLSPGDSVQAIGKENLSLSLELMLEAYDHFVGGPGECTDSLPREKSTKRKAEGGGGKEAER